MCVGVFVYLCVGVWVVWVGVVKGGVQAGKWIVSRRRSITKTTKRKSEKKRGGTGEEKKKTESLRVRPQK